MKKNIRKIPQNISAKIHSFNGENIVVGCAKQFSAVEIKNGTLAHLQVRLGDDGILLPEHLIPPVSRGRYSERNRNGHFVKRKDLPKETRYHPVEAPNWGDEYNGTHTVWLPNEAYPLEFCPPRELELLLNCQDKTPARATYIITVRVNDVLNQADNDFEQNLFSTLNLLQENLGTCDVHLAATSIEEYSRTLQVSWEILPPGSKEEAIKRLFSGKNPTKHEYDVARERIGFFELLQPRTLIVGSSGFRRYIGALLEDDLVVFENFEYGNAVYLLYENWQELSQRTRIDLLSGQLGNTFDRIIHRDGWQYELRERVIARRANHIHKS